MTVDPSFLGKVIGSGGETIKSIIAETGVANIHIDKSDSAEGNVVISGTDDAAINNAVNRIQAIIDSGSSGANGRGAPPPEIKAGDAFAGAEVKSILPFGVFIALGPTGVDGFCHISKLSEEYVETIDDVALSVGDSVDVEVTEVTKKGRKLQYGIKITSPLQVNARSR